MNKLSFNYPESGLTIDVSVYKLPGETLDNSGVCNEVGTTGVYIYEFEDDGTSDYSYTATSTGYSPIGGTVFAETTSGGGATVADIWSAQIGDHSGVAGSFANKFEQYGGVSHVIDRSRFDEESKKELEDMRKSFKKLSEDIQKSIGNIKPPQVISEGKTTVIKYDDKSNKFIEDFITETIPELADKIDNLIPLLKTYEELILDFEQKEKDYEKLIEELINNK